MLKKSLFLFGRGWGAIAAYKSLIKKFPTLTVVTNDENLNYLAGDNSKEVNLESIIGAVIIFDAYYPIVPKNVLDNNICINVHYSLLPRYRGIHPTVWALLNDEDYLGGTVHLMTEYIDDGDIIYQWKVANDRIRTSADYMRYHNKHMEDNLGDIIEKFLRSEIQPVPQDKEKASWVPRRNLQDCKIDFSLPLSWQERFWRCLVPPYPEPYIEWEGERLVAKVVSFKYSSEISHIGRIVNIDNEGIWVKCKDGYIIIHKLIDTNNSEYPLKRFRIGMYLDNNLKHTRQLGGAYL